MMSIANEPLFLQWKEARQIRSGALRRQERLSAPRPAGRDGTTADAARTDVFLGWLTGQKGYHGYVRQLRDAKIKPLVETFDAETLTAYGQACGWALARAHAKAGDALLIGGYLGSKDVFDEAMGDSRSPTPTRPSAITPPQGCRARGQIDVHLEA